MCVCVCVCVLLMQEMLVLTSVQDAAESVPLGYNCTAGVSVWGRRGKHLVSQFFL